MTPQPATPPQTNPQPATSQPAISPATPPRVAGVAVVVPARDEAELVARCLASIRDARLLLAGRAAAGQSQDQHAGQKDSKVGLHAGTP